jgi:AraC-like DNA-binding protein
VRDPAALYGALSKAAPIKVFHSHVPDRLFVHHVGCVDVGAAVVTSHSGTHTDFVVEHTPNLHLVALFHGHIAIQTAGGAITLDPNGAALLPPGLRRSNGKHSLAAVTLLPKEVSAAAAAMAGGGWGLPKAFPKLEGSSPLSLPSGPQAQMVHHLLHTINASLTLHPEAANHLALDDTLHRAAAALLHPPLLSEEPADLERYRDTAGRTSFDDLIDYIRAHLDQPLRLTDLEARSHYSRRALQYAFRQRLNTTPKQWIREQRLALALEHLQRDGERPSVQEVALLCGYGHLSHFSRDFRARYGMNPSEARRL